MRSFRKEASSTWNNFFLSFLKVDGGEIERYPHVPHIALRMTGPAGWPRIIREATYGGEKRTPRIPSPCMQRKEDDVLPEGECSCLCARSPLPKNYIRHMSPI
jgi:hypothetical protein